MLTPIEIRQQTFNREFRGYDRVEVDAFLQEVAKVLENQIDNNRKLKEEMEKIQASYRTLKEVEGMLHKTLMQAEQSSKNTMENARQKADLKVREAEAKARELIQDSIEKRKNIEHEINELYGKREEIYNQLKLFLDSQMERLVSFEQRKELPPSQRQPKPQPNKATTDVSTGNNSIFEVSTSENKNGMINGLPAHTFYDDLADEL